jgi:hypothetical protein
MLQSTRGPFIDARRVEVRAHFTAEKAVGTSN